LGASVMSARFKHVLGGKQAHLVDLGVEDAAPLDLSICRRPRG